jgi:hypothetical protein
LEKQSGRLWTGFIRLRVGTSGNEPSGSIKAGDFSLHGITSMELMGRDEQRGKTVDTK